MRPSSASSGGSASLRRSLRSLVGTGKVKEEAFGRVGMGVMLFRPIN
ncbi:hypothetical protein HMPREF9440_00307 [Sutterella parvirubra YIT 11816]|uniref:Uncharacterized protein n=1 Tax=Sutterella parvirubra YIT 11816 TaxID=762967 RepID=H3KC56_9BURK|nr:hypothetical protein HMPREF9440_00307 [Sutterella parvirubra YIT 11816]